MYSMKEACALTGMTYENLKFYCKEGLVPNVKRTAAIIVSSMTTISNGSRVSGASETVVSPSPK